MPPSYWTWTVRCRCGWRATLPSFDLPAACPRCENVWYSLLGAQPKPPYAFPEMC